MLIERPSREGETAHKRNLPSIAAFTLQMAFMFKTVSKLGAQSGFQVCHMSVGIQEIGPSSTAFPKLVSMKLDWKWINQDSNSDPGVAGSEWR